MEDRTAKMASSIQELCEELLRVCKDLMNERRLWLYAETCLVPIVPELVTSKKSMHTHLLPYHTPVAQLYVPDKFDGTQGVREKVFATQIGLYTVANGNLFIDNHIKTSLFPLVPKDHLSFSVSDIEKGFHDLESKPNKISKPFQQLLSKGEHYQRDIKGQ